MAERSIIHLNITDFAVAVERLQDPSLQQVPLIVAPQKAARALVHDMSEEAYQDGVRKGMPLEMARRRCRLARILPPRPALYHRAMVAVTQRALPYTPQVEPGNSDGHLFLDVSGSRRLFGPARDIARRLRHQLIAELSLNPSWTLATNKLVAKTASRLVRPVGEYIVAPGQESDFLAPLPLALLPGLSKAEVRLLAEFNLVRVEQLRQLTCSQLRVILKQRADFLHNISRGHDQTPVLPGENSNDRLVCGHHFDEDTDSPELLHAVLTRMVHTIGGKLRRRNLLGRRMGIRLIHSDGRSVVRQATVKKGTDSDFVLRGLALTALARAQYRRVRIRDCILICDRLLPRSPQQPLFTLTSRQERRERRILKAMDLIHHRFGSSGIGLGNAGIDMGAMESRTVHGKAAESGPGPWS